jgi:membrane-associated phospholipid phosphatase
MQNYSVTKKDTTLTNFKSKTQNLADSCMDTNQRVIVCSNESAKDSMILNPNYLPKWYEMITNVPGDWWRFAKEEYESPNYPVYLLITGLTAGLILTDDITYKESDKFYKKTQINRNFSDIFTKIGDGRTQFGLAAGFATFGFIADDHRALRTASQIVEGVLAAGAVVQLIKHITGRQSPFVATSPTGIWRFFPNQIEYHKHVPSYDAFPSGHIATSVAAFVIISENYPEYSNWIDPICYALSTCICIGMVNSGIHWYSDYPLGIAIGYAFGKLIANPKGIGLAEKKGDFRKLSVFPYYNENYIGLTFNYSLR